MSDDLQDAPNPDNPDLSADPPPSDPPKDPPPADPAPPQDDPPAPPEASDWRAAIEDQKLREFAGKFTSPADLAKAALEFRQKLSKGLTPPAEDAPDEEKAAFRKALGVPETPEGYEFTMPEGKEVTDADKAIQTKLATVFHETGTPASTAKALSAAVLEMAEEAAAEQERVATAAREASEAKLKKELGAEYEPHKQLAGRVVRTYGSPELIDMLETTVVNGQKLGDHPEMLRLFGTLGRRMDEHGFIGAASESEQSTIQDELNEIMRNNPPGTDKYRDPSVQKRIRELNEKLYGTGPAVGAGGRSV